ncbi:hypothetical protein SteCoe_30718 [Stentor coeruleus]|uniref:Uncharacterized protein n=1 Tax=Stentor coeruleus TaxID=5963 RepID=A0A1R2B309_9CILI|nr:hypothetical protein SteCoe_30718 [Stentor coeruleus]
MESMIKELKELNFLPKDAASDQRKLRFLGSLLIIHHNYSEMKKYSIRSMYATGSIESPYLIENTEFRHGSFVISRTSSVRSSRVFSFFSKKKIYNDDEVNMIKFAFEKCIGNFQGHDQNSGNRTLYIYYFIQFLLDCYIITQHFMSLFLLPLNKEKYIDSDKFVLALESIQQMSFERASFFYQERDSQFKQNVAIQKMLFFFKFVEYCCGSDLTETDLACALSLSLRNSKKNSDYKDLSKKTFDKLQKLNQGVRKATITFQEFSKILMVKK